MTFKLVATLTAALFAILCATLVFAPQLMIEPWDVAVTAEATFMGRRLAAGFFGIALMSWSARQLPVGAGRQAIAVSVIGTMLFVAAMGAFELFRGFAGLGILTAIGVELMVAAGFFLTFRKES